MVNMSLTRRSLAALFPVTAAAQQHQEPGVLPSKAYPFEHLTGRQSNSIEAYQILHRQHAFRLPSGSA
jgi:hypothetical protein